MHHKTNLLVNLYWDNKYSVSDFEIVYLPLSTQSQKPRCMSLSSAITKNYDTYSGNLPVAEAPTESSQLPLSSMNTWWNKLEVSASANQRWQLTAWLLTMFVNMAMAFKFNRVNPVTCLTTIIGRSCQKDHFCQDKSFVATSLFLS